jgi:transcriptional regulator with XRE-family HTH domain
MTAQGHIVPDVLAKAIGAELRKTRQALGWTRKVLNGHLGRDVSLQTIATWELGTRKISVQSLFDSCGAMRIRPSDFLAAVEDRCEYGRDEITVDIRDLAVHGPPGLAPARRWAHARLRPDLPTDVRLTPEAVQILADLCEIEPSEMEDHLRACGVAEDCLPPEEDTEARDHVPLGHGART